MPYLKSVSITFHTHNDNKNDSTVVHVFVKNRLNSSLSPEHSTDFISNMLAYQRYLSTGDLKDDRNNPYLASGVGLAATEGFPDPSSRTFDLTLRADDISVDEVVLPVVNIHILTDGNDRWIFDYTITFTFDNAAAFTFSSNVAGIKGIILDQDNRNYSGICIENPLRTLPDTEKPVSNAVLKKVTLEFATHNDNKDADTQLNVHIVNRLSATSARDIAIGLDLFKGEEFPDAGSSSPLSYKQYSWSADDSTLASDDIRLADIMLPVVYIIIVPNGNDRWIFDYRVTFEFSDPQNFEGKPYIYSSRTDGIILDQDNNKYAGVYQGAPFPTVAPPTAPRLFSQPVDHRTTHPKIIPLSFLREKFDQFINNRNGSDASHNPPLKKVHLHNSGRYNDAALPESYFDLRSITAGRGKVNYVSSPTSVGQLANSFLGIDFGDLYLNDINSSALSLNIDATRPAPFALSIDFETGGAQEIVGGGSLSVSGMDLLKFSISLELTLDIAPIVNRLGVVGKMVDLMSWVSDIQSLNVAQVSDPNESSPSSRPIYRYTGTFLHQPVDLVSTDTIGDLFTEQVIKVAVTTSSSFDLGGSLRRHVRDAIFAKLTTPDIITGRTARDSINSIMTSWLLGGTPDDERNTDQNNTVISSIGIKDDNIVISYTGPRNVFAAQAPVDWPTAARPSAAHDFSPGNLSNIDHIVVLTMENRSFDHMLGYLSLPPALGGMGRSDVDGLKGGEANSYNGKTYRSFALSDTYFPLDPPHGYEPVHQAINNGRMDGFVRSYAEQHGSAIAGQIMGHHAAATVPVYDALARDFAIGHRWFASHPGPTFCNRNYELMGRLNLDTRGFWEFDNSSPIRPVFAKTIFDYLSDATDPVTGQKVTWTYFEHGYCFLRFFEGYTFEDRDIVRADDPEIGFYASARAGRLPSVSFIDPHYIELPPDATDDGPPADVKDGQVFVSKIVEAVVASPAWDKTLLVIIYDEHGGFYDHVPPPAAAKVSDDLPISTYGVRVPAFVISPWVGAGTVFGHDGIATQPGGSEAPEEPRTTAVEEQAPATLRALHFDHTSVLKTIARRFMSTNPPYMGARYAAASDLSAVIGNNMRRPQFLPFIRYNIEFSSSQMMLDVKGANPAPGAPLWQFAANGTVAQDFSFEDADDGFVYIRSHVSNLYLTAHTPGEVVATGVAATAARVGTPAATNATDPILIQDIKYAAPRIPVITNGPGPELQKWKLTLPAIPGLERNMFLIANQAHPGKVLQPANPTQAGAMIVLSDAGQTLGIHGPKNTWKVSSPLISDTPVIKG